MGIAELPHGAHTKKRLIYSAVNKSANKVENSKRTGGNRAALNSGMDIRGNNPRW
jgi:hypothetical protein